MTPVAGGTSPTFADAVRRRVEIRVLPALGPRRVAVVADEDARPEEGGPPAAVVVRVAGRRRRGDVAGAVERLPVQSESATGVLFHHVRPSAAALREAVRLLQPGGCVVVTGRGPAEEVRAIDAAARSAGLATVSRRAVLRPGVVGDRAAPSWFLGLAVRRELRAATRCAESEPVEWVLVARLPGGDDVEFPDARGILGSMFLPARWRRGGRDEAVRGGPGDPR